MGADHVTAPAPLSDFPATDGGPRRIQLSRREGYRKPEGAIVVSRPSRWGNPYRVARDRTGQWLVAIDDGMVAVGAAYSTRALATDAAVGFFRQALLLGELPVTVDDVRRELAGRDLACWCGDGPCHADVLLALANAGQEVTT
jgi:hypothetical protein